MKEEIRTYHQSQTPDRKVICDELYQIISDEFTGLENKLWHGAPVWFIEGNPIVGYDVLKDSVRLLFWSGQSFDEPGLEKEGSFKAAEVRYTDTDQINKNDLRRWLEKSKTIQWDYKNIVKRRGKLERLK
jgi:hypothetical protein